MWNVKIEITDAETGEYLVLIETLWNVKRETTMQDIAQALRINRNIVECKVYYVSVFRDPAHVLIETLWNVKIDEIK